MARVLFVQDALFESFSPQILAAVLRRAGHECQLLILACEHKGELTRRLRTFRPDIVAFSITSFGFGWSLEAAAVARRETKAVTVFGGPHPTFQPDFAKRPEVDIACRGEGEGAILDLADAVDRGEDPRGIANMMSRDERGELRMNPLRPLVADLDTLPFPARDLHFQYAALRDLPYKRFMVGRGCPYACTYCFNTAQRTMYSGLGCYVRLRTAENVIAEILDIRSRFGIGVVGFVDDCFTTSKKWLLPFLDLYRREVGLPFTCLTRANEVDEEVAAALGRAGCRFASFGVEAGNEKIRNTILDRHMSNAQIRNAAALLHANKVKFLTYNMFAVPGETAENGLETVRLNVEIGSDLCSTSVFHPLVGTKLYEFCQSEGYLDENYSVDDYAGLITAHSPLRNMPDTAFLERLQKLAFIGVLFPALIPLIARLARLPLGAIYGVIFKASVALRNKVRFQLSWLDVIRLGLRSRGRFG